MPDIRDVHRYGKTLNERLELEAKVKELKAIEKKLHDRVLEYFEDQQIQKISVDGRTLYARREIWARKVNGASEAAIVRALDEAGLADFHADKPSWSSLSAKLREFDADGEPIPSQLEGLIEANEVWKVGNRKAGNGIS
jgi:hypothetical protein